MYTCRCVPREYGQGVCAACGGQKWPCGTPQKPERDGLMRPEKTK